jgi:hypothetical protein
MRLVRRGKVWLLVAMVLMSLSAPRAIPVARHLLLACCSGKSRSLHGPAEPLRLAGTGIPQLALRGGMDYESEGPRQLEQERSEALDPPGGSNDMVSDTDVGKEQLGSDAGSEGELDSAGGLDEGEGEGEDADPVAREQLRATRYLMQDFSSESESFGWVKDMPSNMSQDSEFMETIREMERMVLEDAQAPEPPPEKLRGWEFVECAAEGRLAKARHPCPSATLRGPLWPFVARQHARAVAPSFT